MKILSLDTSTKVASIAVMDENNLLAEYFINNDENKKENEKKNIKIKEKNINIKGEKNKLKKVYKHKVESKINKGISSLKKQIVIKRKNK